MADNTLNIAVQAETDPAQRSISALADDIEKLGAELGGKLGAKAQEAASKLRDLGQQEAAVQNFQRLGEEVNKAEQHFGELQAEVVRYSTSLGQTPSAAEQLQLGQLQKQAADAGKALEGQRAQLQAAQRIMEGYGLSVGGSNANLLRIQETIRQTAQNTAQLSPVLARNMEGWGGVTTAAGRLSTVAQKTGQVMVNALRPVTGVLDSLRNKFGALVDLQLGKFSFKGLVDSIQQLQDVRVALGAVAGSAEAAGKQFDFVKRVANSAGTDIAESAGQWMKLSAAAKGTALEGKATQEVFAAVTHAMSNMGRSSGETGAVLQTLTQIINGEDVSARQLERTLGTQLPGALQAAAKGFGVTEAELRKMLDSGEITAEKLLPALAKGLEETVNSGPAVAKVSDAFQVVKNEVLSLADALGEGGVSKALVWFSDLAVATVAGVRELFIGLGQTIGAVFGLITTGDFAAFKQSLADIESESAKRLAATAQHSELVRAAMQTMGTEIEKAALAEADAAAKTAEAGGAAAAAAPQLEALGMSYKALGDEVAKVKDTEALELEVIQGRIKAAEEDIKMEGLSAEAKLAAQKSLEKARQAEVNFYAARLKKQGELLAAAQEQLKAEQAAAAVSEEEKKRREPLIEQLKTLVNMREKDVQKTMEQIRAAQKAADASSKEVRAAEDARKALEAKNKTRKMESDALIKSLEAQKESARIGEELAQQMGNEYKARQFKIQQLEIEVKITLAKAEAARAEAQDSIDVARAKIEEMRAAGTLTDAKKAEQLASIALGEARLKEAAAIKESARLQQNYVQQVRYSANATGEATATAAKGWREVAAEANNARSAVDGYSHAVRGAPQPPSSGSGSDGDSSGNRNASTTRHTWKSLYEYAKSSGADEALARELADAQFNAQGGWTGNLQQRYRRGKLDFFNDEVAVQRAIEQQMRAGGSAAGGSANTGDGQTQRQTGSTVNINLNGKRTTIGVANDADAHQLERLLREIANDQGRAA